MKKVLSLALALMMLLSLCITPVMAAEPEGSESNPYYIANPMMAPDFITIPANSTVYYQYNATVFGGWTVEGYGLSAIIVDGIVYDEADMWGTVVAPFDFTMMSPGIVGYVNNTGEDVDVMLNHTEPMGSAENPYVLGDGDNSFFIPTTLSSYVAVYMPMATGEYTFATAQAEDFEISVDVDGEIYAMQDGSLTLSLESYCYVLIYVTPVGMTGDCTLTVVAPEAGTEANPLWLDTYCMEDAYTLTAGKELWFQLDGTLAGNTMTIASVDGADFAMQLDGVDYASENGVLSLSLETADWYYTMMLLSDVDTAVLFTVDFAQGSNENPFEIGLGDTTVSIPAGVGGYYYAYTVEADGLLIVTPSAVDGIGYLGMYDEEYNDTAYLQYGSSSMMMPVTAGEVIMLDCSATVDEDTFEYLPLDVVLNLALKEMVLYSTFENGELGQWNSSSDLTVDEEEYLSGWYSAKFNVNNDWGNIFAYVSLEPNTDYLVSFKAKAAQESGMWVKFNKDWAYDVAKADVSLTTEVAEYEVIINSGELGSAVLLFQYAGYAKDGQIIWLDDIVITKAEAGDIPVPPVVSEGFVNGDFETGDASGWETWQDTVISADAAHSGSFGAHLIGNGSWGGMLNQTLSVTPGKMYMLSFWINVNKTGVNVQVKDSSGASIEGAGGWFDAKNVDKQVEWIFTAMDNTVLVNFCGSGSAPEDVYVDDFVLTELFVKEPSFDGYIGNGDFETGDLTAWENLWGSCDVSFVEGYESDNAISIVAGNWQQVRQDGIAVEPNTDYVLSAWVKNATNFGLIVKKGDDSGDINSYYIESISDWTHITLSFNSGDQTEICVLMIGWDGGGSAIFDNVSLAEDGGDVPVPPVVSEGIVNGDFETGDATGWETWQGTEISTDAAHNGSYGAHLIGNGSWGGMLNQTVTVVPGKVYKLSFWINVNKTGVNVQVKDGSGASIEGAGAWFDAKNVDKLVEWTFTATDDTVLINFCGSGSAPEDVYVDDFALTEVIVKEPSFDGYIYNGDFETGDLSSWNNLWGSCDVSFVEGYESDTAINIVAGGWNQVRQDAIKVEPNTDYVLTAWVKNATNFGLIVKTGDDSGDINNVYIESIGDWTQVSVSFNSGDQTEICVLMIGWEGGGSAIIDNVTIAEDAAVEPDYLPGDVNGDGRVNNKDLGIMKQYLADWEDLELNLNACDVDGNGRINNKDMGLLQQYLNDWDVELLYGAVN